MGLLLVDVNCVSRSNNNIKKELKTNTLSLMVMMVGSSDERVSLNDDRFNSIGFIWFQMDMNWAHQPLK